ncbi:MAG: type III secretion system inner membrane ring lipoprotein SctJ [Sphingorhabdus sp.]
MMAGTQGGIVSRFGIASPALLAMFMALALLLSGCSQQNLYANQTEEHANEMIAVLGENGIEAQKSPGEEGTYNVDVAQGDFAKAVEILRARGLPREQFESLGTIFKPGGLNETPLAQRARLIYGLQQELSQTISEIDGVVTARVQLAMPQPDPLSQEIKPSSASVLVKYRTGFDLRSQTSAIKALVANGVEGLAYDNVSVVMVPAQALPQDKNAGDTISLATLGKILLGLLAFAILVFAGRAMMRARRKRAVSAELVETNST